jgi:Ser/Thr protein kinase RdoA (MazF antagonist)
MLFDGKVPNQKGASVAQQAEQLTKRFLRYYHHAVPFDRRVVEAVWSRCRGEDCAARERAAWQEWRSLDEDVAPSASAVPSEGRRSGSDWDTFEEDAGVDSLETR